MDMNFFLNWIPRMNSRKWILFLSWIESDYVSVSNFRWRQISRGWCFSRSSRNRRVKIIWPWGNPMRFHSKMGIRNPNPYGKCRKRQLEFQSFVIERKSFENSTCFFVNIRKSIEFQKELHSVEYICIFFSRAYSCLPICWNCLP